MKVRTLLGLAALVPAAFGTGPAPALAAAAPLCSGGGPQAGAARLVTIPLDRRVPASGGDPARPCCAKGCHAGGSRKRGQPAI